MSLRARQSGFTLLEILLSVSLLALLVGLAYGSIRVATKASTSGERLIERTEEMRTVQQFMRRQISQMMSAPFDYVVDDGGEKRFEGSEDAIQFVAPMPGYLSHGGPHVQRLEIVRGDRGRQLQFRFAQLNGWDPEAGFPDDAEPVVLIDGIRDGGFSFRRLDENGELDDWENEWEMPVELPVMLRLELDFDDDDPRHWPVFEAASLVATSNSVLSFDSLRPRAPGFGSPSNPKPREAP
ncbi:MAG: prepilin-type N-terminal cleavage/methylation domain-containing protein [Xanthomonadales bacterium]|nr:prepilin-type N-terminal cleavage/methylation domain-containing protein [Xanthomonadales bacterium]